MTVDLDTRMRAARDSLLGAADHVSPRRPTRPPRSLRPAAIVAVAVAMVLVVVGVAVRPDHQDSLRTVIVPPSTVPRLVPTHMPPGVLAPVVQELPFPSVPAGAEDFSLGSATVTIYGDPRAADPFAAADLAVGVTRRDPGLQLGGSEVGGHRVTVRGRSGLAFDIGTARFISWQERPGMAILIGSRTLEPNQVLAAADALVVRGGRVTLGPDPAGLRGPLDEVADVPDYPVEALTEAAMPLARNSAAGHLVGNQSAHEEDPSFYILTAKGDADDLALIRWVTHADTPTRTRGHRAWGDVEVADGIAERTLVWQEAPGVVAVVVGTGIDQHQFEDAVAGLHPATGREWRSLLAATAKTDANGGG